MNTVRAPSMLDLELRLAALENNLPEVRRLFSVGADVNGRDLLDNTPLHWACLMGHVQVFKVLREHGADIEATNRFDRTPLHVACGKGHLVVVNELLSPNDINDTTSILGKRKTRGADTEARDKDGNTPLHFASEGGHLAVVKALVSDGANILPVVKELLDHGAAVDAKDDREWTPLHCACYNGHVAVVNELVSRGANIAAKTYRGNTPLHFAALHDHLAIVKALISGGANILTVDNDERLPIHLAVSYGHSKVSKYLLREFYATIHRLRLHELLKDLTWIGDLNSSGILPLRDALHRDVLGTDDVVEIIEYLVGRNPALLSSRDQDGSLALHLACRHGASFTIVQSLVDLYEASVKSLTPHGDLPLFLACELPEPSLDTIFILVKLYPDLVYR
jgi:ankyrin repeat protein